MPGHFQCLFYFICQSNTSLPNRALNAGSTFPLLARKTALTTARSTEGKASRRVFSACCAAVNGRGGLGGPTSSPAGCEASAVDTSIGAELGLCRGSSSKSSSFAVVGDSGRPLGFCARLVN